MSQAGPASARPTSIAELRAVTQPPEVRGRRNAEHWTASLYLRRFSPYLTWMLLKTPISANGVTGLMILVGWSTAAALLIPGVSPTNVGSTQLFAETSAVTQAVGKAPSRLSRSLS